MPVDVVMVTEENIGTFLFDHDYKFVAERSRRNPYISLSSRGDLNQFLNQIYGT